MELASDIPEPERELKDEPTDDGGEEEYSSSSSIVWALKRLVSCSTVTPYEPSRICLVACGEIGFGDWIWDVERGRPLGMSAVAARDSRREVEDFEDEEWEEDFEDDLEDEEDLLEEEDLEEDFLEELDEVTSRMFRTRPVVGSVVESSAGLWETW